MEVECVLGLLEAKGLALPAKDEGLAKAGCELVQMRRASRVFGVGPEMP